MSKQNHVINDFTFELAWSILHDQRYFKDLTALYSSIVIFI